MCMRDMIKIGSSLILTLGAFGLLFLMLGTEFMTADPSGYSAYFQWAYIAGLLLIVAGFAYIVLLGQEDVATLDEAHQAHQNKE